MIEHWMQWKPIEGLSKKYALERLINDTKAFTLFLFDVQDKKKRVQLAFEDFIVSYRDTDESFRLKAISSLEKQYGGEFFGRWTFFKVINSSYIKWVCEESQNLYTSEDFIHFSLITSNAITDIIATYEPQVTITNEQ